MAGLHRLIAAFVTLVFLISGALSEETSYHFTVKQVWNSKHVRRSLEYEYARALSKYGHHDNFLTTRSARSNGSVITRPEPDDEAFLSPVTVGKQSMLVNLDTGSSDFWVFSSFQVDYQREGHAFYTPGPEAIDLNSTFHISYGDGTFAFGKVFLDNVTLGSISVEKQAVEAATRVAPSMVEDRNNSGIMGLGFGHLNKVRPEKQKTFFENALPHLSSPVFAASLKNNAPGSYDIGYINKTKYEGDLHYTPVNNTLGYWTITMAGFQVGNGTKIKSSFTALADTGTTLALLPEPVVKEYYSKVPGAVMWFDRIWTFPCNTTLPDFGLMINDNYTAVIPGHYLKYKNTNPDRSSECYGGIQPARHEAILGAMFLKSQYVVFDYGALRVGFAPQAKDNQSFVGRSGTRAIPSGDPTAA